MNLKEHLLQALELLGCDPSRFQFDDHSTIAFIQSQLKDALLVSKHVKSKMNRTFNNFDKSTPAVKRIDYIFINEYIHVQSFETLVEPFGVSFPSDHFPILAHLKIK